MIRILESDENDDVKAKQYHQILSRFLKLKKDLETVAETVEEPKIEVKSKPITQSKRQPSPEPIRKSARGKKEKLRWEPY
jgi:hypothetical protein